jgi:outer membrane protein assembly factor BamB
MVRGTVVVALLALLALPSSALAAPPTITGFSPASGPAGTVVTITGTGFTGATKVTFGGVSAAFNVLSPTTIRTVVPPLAQSGVVIVQTPGGSTESRTMFGIAMGIVPSVRSAPPGGHFLLSGSGFPPNSSFTMELDSVATRSGFANRVGGFGGLTITLPAEETLDFHTLSLVLDSGATFPIRILVQADWPFARQNVYGSGQNVLESTLNISTVNSMGEKWAFPTITSAGTAPPVVVGGVMYVGSINGRVFAVSTSTHKKLWSVQPGLAIDGSPAVANNTVYIGDGGSVYALDATTGATKWSISTSQSPATRAPIVVGGTVYFGGYNGSGATLWAVNGATGVVKWSKQLSTALYTGSPAFSNGLVYVGTFDGTIWALHASNGSVAWSQPTGGPILGTPVVRGGLVIVVDGAKSGNVDAFDATTGAPNWSFPEDAKASPAFDAGKVFVTTSTGVTALQATTGKTLWSFSLTPALSANPASPAVANGLVYTDYDGFPIAVIESTGAEIWQAPAQLQSPASPIVVDGQVFVGDENDEVHVYSP